MKCRDARELINSYIDNGLDPKLDAHLMEHVKTCTKCSRGLELMLEYKDAVKRIRPVKAPDNFMAELHRRIEAESGSRFTRLLNDAAYAWRHFRFPYEAVGVIAVAMLVFFLYTPVFHREKTVVTFNENQPAPRYEEKGSSPITDAKLPLQNKKTASKDQPLPSIQKEKTVMEKLSDSDMAEKDTAMESRADEEKKEIRGEGEKAATGAYSSDITDSAVELKQGTKSKNFTEFSKKADKAPAPVTPDIIFSGSGAVIVSREVKDGGKTLYTVKVKNSAIKALTEKLKLNYTVSVKIISAEGEFSTAEFSLTKKSE